MPKYIYTAKSLDGETKTGNLEAKDIHQLAQTLRQESLILIRARPEGLEKKKFNFSFSLPRTFRRDFLRSSTPVPPRPIIKPGFAEKTVTVRARGVRSTSIWSSEESFNFSRRKVLIAMSSRNVLGKFAFEANHLESQE